MAAWGSHNTTGNKPASQTSRSTHFPAPINPENTPKSIPGTTGINHTVPRRTTRSTLPKQHQPVKPTNPHTSRHQSSRKHPERSTPETIRSITPPLTRRPDQHYPKQQPGTNPEPSSQQPETTHHPTPATGTRQPNSHEPSTGQLGEHYPTPTHHATQARYGCPHRPVLERTHPPAGSSELPGGRSPAALRDVSIPTCHRGGSAPKRSSSLRRHVLSEPPTSTRSRRRQASPGVYPPTTVR